MPCIYVCYTRAKQQVTPMPLICEELRTGVSSLPLLRSMAIGLLRSTWLNYRRGVATMRQPPYGLARDDFYAIVDNDQGSTMLMLDLFGEPKEAHD